MTILFGLLVTHVELAMGGMQMLANEKLKFDFILANINSPDVQAFKLLQLAVSMNTPIISKSNLFNLDLYKLINWCHTNYIFCS